MVGKEKIIGRFKLIFKSRFGAAAFIVLIAVAGLVSWRTLGNRKEQFQYQTAQVERGTIVSSVSASGQIISSHSVNVATEASGIVKKIFVKEGDAVSAGQKILEIELDRDGQIREAQSRTSYLAAQNGLESAKQSKLSLLAAIESDKGKLITAQTNAKGTDGWDPTDTNKQKIDAERRAAELNFEIDQQKLGSVETSIRKAQVDLQSAWLSYQQALPTVTAPVSGTVAGISVAEGMNIGSQSSSSSDGSQSQSVAVVKTQNRLLASFNLSEIDVPQVKTDQKATITIDSLSGKTFTGRVVSVDRVGSVSSGVTNYPVIVQFDIESPQILPNMAAAVSIIIETKDNVLLVPSSAVQKQGDQNIVRVMKDGREQVVTVETGLASDTQTEILSGLSEGDEVITSMVASSSSSQQGGSILGGGLGGGAGRMFTGR